MPSPSASPSKPPPLPSLLAHLRTSSSPSTPSVSLSLDQATPSHRRPSTLSTRVPRSPSARSLKDPPRQSGATSAHSPAETRTRTSTAPAAPASARAQENDDDARGTSPAEARSRSSSSSSLEGLARRLQGAREGKGRGLVLASHSDDDDALDPSKGEDGDRAQDDDAPRHAEEGDVLLASPSPPSPPLPPLPARSRQSSYAPSLASLPPISSSSVASPALSSLSTTAIAADSAFPIAGEAVARGDDEQEEEDDDEEEGEDEEQYDLPARHEGQPDPREMLRAQLARPTPAVGAGRPPAPPSSEQPAREAAGANAEEMEGKEVVRTRYLPRRYFVLSTAGKLVWTSDPDEEEATGLVGVMQALVSIFASEGDKIRFITTGATRIAFLLKAPLYLVVVSNGWGEPESILRTHLSHLHLLVQSVVTLAQLQAMFARRSNADLRRVLEGTEPFFHALTHTLQHAPLPVLTSAIEVYRCDPAVRDECARALERETGREVVKDLDLLYVLLVSRARLVTLLRPKKHSIHPTDLHLLLSTIYASSPTPASPSAPSPAAGSPAPVEASEKPEPKRRRRAPLTEPGAEAWFPVCLPRFNARGFLYAYVSFLPSSSSTSSTSPAAEGAKDDDEADSGTGLVLLSSRRDAFERVAFTARAIKARLVEPRSVGFGGGKGRARARGGRGDGGVVHELEMERSAQEYSLGELAIPGLRHFVYKHRGLVQVTRPAWEGEYRDEGGEGRCRLITLYETVHDALHPRPAAAGSPARPPAQVQYVRTAHEAVLGWITPAFELYVATAPLLPHAAVVSAARAVSRWVGKEEARLFLRGAPSF
ncbi:hypothetical protein JCM10207_002611 [Rhodosporidiobolus poonsookiae]